MIRKLLLTLLTLDVLAAAPWVIASGLARDGGATELLNVACDPTRELGHDLSFGFQKHQPIQIRQSHGGSASCVGTWDEIHTRFFAEGSMFDSIFAEAPR